jgi:hypothetical protein
VVPICCEHRTYRPPYHVLWEELRDLHETQHRHQLPQSLRSGLGLGEDVFRHGAHHLVNTCGDDIFRVQRSVFKLAEIVSELRLRTARGGRSLARSGR